MANDYAYGACPNCGAALPPPTVAAHQCVGRINFNPTAATAFPLRSYPIPTTPTMDPRARVEALTQRLAEKDAQIETLTRERDEAEREMNNALDEMEEHAEARIEHWKARKALESRFSLLVQAAKEYMTHVEDDDHNPNIEICAERQALMDAIGDGDGK